jgi:hypothetical protein
MPTSATSSLPIACARRPRARRWIARWRLVAMAFPSLGPWPWLIAEAWAHPPAAHAHAPAPDADGHDAQPFPDHHASGIPGTPTHPADHHCVECEVLQHLARCVPVVAPPPDAAPLALPPLVVVRVEAATLHRSGPAPLPPARAPPARPT